MEIDKIIQALESEEVIMIQPFDKCPICGGGLSEKAVEKLLRGGNHTATITVKAEVCHHCGERLYDKQTIKQFEEIREKLLKQKTVGLKLLGNSYRA